MRNHALTKTLMICSAALAVAIILNAFLLHAVRKQYAPGKYSLTSLFVWSGQVHEWLDYFHQWKNLAAQNASLTDLADKYKASEARIQALESENDSLRKAAGLSLKIKRNLIPAGIFQISLQPSGYHALLNKGQNDGIISGQAVVSEDGLLIGKISNVFPSSAQIILTSDPTFSVTVKVLNGQASGILRGALAESLVLDLITQSDEIKEGDTLVTTGDDLIPAGLIAGEVRNVKNNETQLFKNVKVNPAADPSNYTGAVFVIER